MTGTWMTRKEAAAYLRRTPQSLSQMAYRGLGPKYYRPPGEKSLYRQEDLDEWVTRCVVEPGARREVRHDDSN